MDEVKVENVFYFTIVTEMGTFVGELNKEYTVANTVQEQRELIEGSIGDDSVIIQMKPARRLMTNMQGNKMMSGMVLPLFGSTGEVTFTGNRILTYALVEDKETINDLRREFNPSGIIVKPGDIITAS